MALPQSSPPPLLHLILLLMEVDGDVSASACEGSAMMLLRMLLPLVLAVTAAQREPLTTQ
jgi:hypothetical protein